MANTTTQSRCVIVELTDGVYARTSIPAENHSALRAGFSGYTSNPRWTAAKFLAWKTGRQWRAAVANNQMVVRPSDSMLIPVSELEVSSEEVPSNNPVLRVAFA